AIGRPNDIVLGAIAGNVLPSDEVACGRRDLIGAKTSCLRCGLCCHGSLFLSSRSMPSLHRCFGEDKPRQKEQTRGGEIQLNEKEIAAGEPVSRILQSTKKPPYTTT